MTKCLLLFSGGLDSILAKEILERQEIKVETINFGSCFFNGKKSIVKEHLKIVKNPRLGRGKEMNPCRDCHLLMLKTAAEIMKKKKYDFIATGEVVSQRPFSQSKQQLLFFDKEAGIERRVLRPLSAQIMPETIPEKKGIVDRRKLFGISGKSRKQQLALAKEFKIEEFPSPAGGCILTDKEYSKKLKKLLEVNPKFDCKDARILNYGRVFFKSKTMFVVTRNEQEENNIKRCFKKGDIILCPINFSGPLVLIRNFGSLKIDLEKGKSYILKYSKKIPVKTEIKIVKK